MKRTAMILFLLACFNVQNLFCADEAKDRNKTGAITAIDLQKTTLSIERINDKRPFTFIVGKDILSKFKVGQIVEVTYVKDDKGNRVASKVEISDKPAAEDKKAAVETPSKDKDDLEIGAPKDPSKNK